MSAAANPNLITDNLVFCVDRKDPKVNFSDPVERAQSIDNGGNSTSNTMIYTNTRVSDFMNSYSEITIMTWVTKNRYHTGYAQHPINKWGNNLGGASIVLYHFGDYNSNGDDGEFGWYWGAGGTWSGTYRSTLEVGETAFLCFQYTTNTGSQVWKNGEKIGSRHNTGKGNGGGDTVQNLNIYTTDDYTAHADCVLIYDRDLSDAEILQNYNATKSRFGL